MKRSQKLMIAVITATSCCGFSMAMAASAAPATYTLNPVMVTAQKIEKKDLDTPASTQVITHEDLEKTGQTNVVQALPFATDIMYSGMGPAGTSLSSMTSETIIRGQKNGTLVLVNGTPINWRGKYNLEDFPISSVDRVEIVRGGGSVLYGSQATGGVINIITKTKFNNEVSVGLGNYGQQDYRVSTNAGNFSFAYHYNKWGNVGSVSDSVSNGRTMHNHFKGLEKNDFLMTYRFSDHVDFLYNKNKSYNRWNYVFGDGYRVDGKTRYSRRYERDKDFIQLNLKDVKGISGHIFYNRNTLRSTGTNHYSAAGRPIRPGTTSWRTNSIEKNWDYGYDFHKLWNGNPVQSFLLGTSLDEEKYHSGAKDYSRHVYSAYGQYDRNLTKWDEIILSGRETWTTGAKDGKNYDNFSGQAQYLHKLDNTQSLYFNIGQSFVMPSFSNMYSTGEMQVVGNPNLKPEKGVYTEFGWKKELTNEQYKVALFTTRTKDEISFTRTGGRFYAMNEDTKNKGIEASMAFKYDNGLSWHMGMTYQNPKAKVSTERHDAKTYWDRNYGRALLNGGISYEKDKWLAALNMSYLWDRVMTPSSAHSYKVQPYLLTSFVLKYSPNKQSDIALSIDNILDRGDVVSHTSSKYYATPANYLITYSYRL